MKGIVHSTESFATQDGRGIRFAVFCAGCPLHCPCCHNADTWSGRGTETEPEELAGRILRYRPYFRKGGGATFSGGEPLLQARFLTETARILVENGVGVALDTSGAVWNEEVGDLLDCCELVILDLKQPTEEEYRAFCGGSLQTVERVAEETARRGIPLWLRTVIIPGINDSEQAIGRYAETAGRIRHERYELLGFHTMGFSKWAEAGRENPLKDTPAMDAVRLAELQHFLDGKERE